MEEYVYKLVCAGVDGFIVSCPEAVDLVVRMGGSPVISCVGSVYNKETATFYQKLGVKRIIVPRDLSMKEVESLVRKCPELEFETFIMRNGCILSDGNCLGLHLHKHGNRHIGTVIRSSGRYQQQIIAGLQSHLNLVVGIGNLFHRIGWQCNNRTIQK